MATRKGSATLAERLAADAWRLAGLCRSVRSGTVPAVRSAEGSLRESGLPTDWIGEGLQSLSGRAAELAARAAGEAVSSEIETLAADLAAFQARAERAVGLAGRLAETRARVAAEEQRVELSRREMGTALGLDPEVALLREKGADPSERLVVASAEADQTEARLGRGEVDEAAAALEDANWQATEAAAIVDASLQTFAARETRVEEQRAETERIAALVPEQELVLAGTRESFAESALALGPGDEVHPGADGTVDDNVEEAREEVVSARGKLEGAAAGIRAGRMLAAASLLRQVRGHQKQARFRLAEITAKRARLDRSREDNRGILAGMEERIEESWPELSDDARITEPTLAAFEEASEKVRTARERMDTGREDPLRIGEDLVAAGAGLDRVEGTLAPADRQLHDDAARSIQEAGSKVSEVGGWEQPYGVVIPGRPGAASLEAARALLAQERYAEAREAARTARGQAAAAVTAAVEEVARRRAEEQRRWEEERRRDEERRRERERQQERASSSSISSSLGSSRSGSSGSSRSSSGSGRSSWSGGGSGSGKSGW